MNAVLIDLEPGQLFSDEDKPENMVSVSFRQKDVWKPAMELPFNLASSIYRLVIQMEAIGYDRVRPLMWQSDKMPERLQIDTRQSGQITFANGG